MPASDTVTYVQLRLDGPGCFMVGGIACDGFHALPADAAAVARIRAVIDARAGRVHGPLDGDAAEVDRRGAYGWALDATRPTSPVALEYAVNAAVVGHAIADVRRPDLEMAGLGEGRCGFRLRLRHPFPHLARRSWTCGAAAMPRRCRACRCWCQRPRASRPS
jgi:hypothetical protein